jgi:4-amino-4-deoxy-L-arabinose transferase-like glycosyltransferase
VFEAVDAGNIYMLLLAGIFIAWMLSRLPRPGPRTLFVLSFVTGALFWREPEVIVDVSRYFTQAKHLEMYGVGYFLREWGGEISAWTDMPLVPMLYGLIFKFAGESRLFIQVFTTLLFSLTVVLVSLTGRDLWDEEVGSSAGMLMLAMPYLYTQIPLMLVDVPSMFFLVLSFFTLNRAMERGGVMIALSSLAVVCCVFSKYSMWLMLSVLVVLFLLRLKEGPTGIIFRRGILVFLLAGGVSGVLLLVNHDIVSGQIRFLMDYQRPGLKRWTESFISTFFYQVHPFVTLGALYSFYLAVKKKDIKYIAAAWLVVLVMVMQIKRIRYTVPVFPMLALMSAYGISGIKAEGARRFLLLAAVMSSLVVAVFAYLPFLEGLSARNLKDAGAYVDGLDAERVKVFTLPQKSAVNPAVAVPLLDLYTKKDIEFEYDTTALPPFEKFLKSPLRFTWHYSNPEYYESRNGEDYAVVVISGGGDRSLPGHVEEEVRGRLALKTFGIKGRFRFKTVVTVFSEQ